MTLHINSQHKLHENVRIHRGSYFVRLYVCMRMCFRNADTKDEKLRHKHTSETDSSQPNGKRERVPFGRQGPGCTTNTLLGVCAFDPKMPQIQRLCGRCRKRSRNRRDIRVPQVWWRVVHQRDAQLLLGPAAGHVDESSQGQCSPILWLR